MSTSSYTPLGRLDFGDVAIRGGVDDVAPGGRGKADRVELPLGLLVNVLVGLLQWLAWLGIRKWGIDVR